MTTAQIAAIVFARVRSISAQLADDIEADREWRSTLNRRVKEALGLLASLCRIEGVRIEDVCAAVDRLAEEERAS